MCPDFKAATVSLAEAESLADVAAAVERLAAVIRRSLQPAPPPPALGEAPAARRQAA